MKKLISCLIAIVIMALPFTVAFAAGAEIYSYDIAGKAGEVIIVPVYIKNNPGLMGLGVNITYDDSILTPISVSSGEVTKDGMLNDSIGTDNKAKVKIVWTDSKQTKEDGSIFVVTFKSTEKATQTSLKLSISKGDTFNEKYNDVSIDCKEIPIFFDGSVAGLETTTQKQKSEPQASDIIVAVDTVLQNEGYSSVNDIPEESKEEFAEKVENNLSQIVGSDNTENENPNDIISQYESAVADKWVSDTLNAVDSDVVNSIIVVALNDAGAESIEKLPDNKKQEFASYVCESINTEASDIEIISDRISLNSTLDAVSKLLDKSKEAATEGKIVGENVEETLQDNSKSSSWLWIALTIALVVIILSCVVFILKKRKGNDEENI